MHVSTLTMWHRGRDPQCGTALFYVASTSTTWPWHESNGFCFMTLQIRRHSGITQKRRGFNRKRVGCLPILNGGFNKCIRSRPTFLRLRSFPITGDLIYQFALFCNYSRIYSQPKTHNPNFESSRPRSLPEWLCGAVPEFDITVWYFMNLLLRDSSATEVPLLWVRTQKSFRFSPPSSGLWSFNTFNL